MDYLSYEDVDYLVFGLSLLPLTADDMDIRLSDMRYRNGSEVLILVYRETIPSAVVTSFHGPSMIT